MTAFATTGSARSFLSRVFSLASALSRLTFHPVTAPNVRRDQRVRGIAEIMRAAQRLDRQADIGLTQKGDDLFVAQPFLPIQAPSVEKLKSKSSCSSKAGRRRFHRCPHRTRGIDMAWVSEVYAWQIVGWRVSVYAKNDRVCAALKQATRLRCPTNELIHYSEWHAQQQTNLYYGHQSVLGQY